MVFPTGVKEDLGSLPQGVRAILVQLTAMQQGMVDAQNRTADAIERGNREKTLDKKMTIPQITSMDRVVFCDELEAFENCMVLLGEKTWQGWWYKFKDACGKAHKQVIVDAIG